jgi:thiol-disulfide isomerase/thioredoxin
MDPRHQSLNKGRILFWLSGAVCAVAFIVWSVRSSGDRSEFQNLLMSKAIENVKIMNSQSELVGLADEIKRVAPGKKVIVSLWATWCEPCIAELEGIKTSKERLDRENTTVFLVNIDGGSPSTVIPEVQAWLTANRIEAETHFDFEDAMAKAFQFDGIPYSMGLGADLKPRWTHLGPLDLNDPDVRVDD